MSRQKKVYYKISEVSQRTGIEEHKLRYWETKIKYLKPRRFENNQRLYTDSDIKVILKIKYYLARGVKLEALNAYLLGKRKTVVQPPEEFQAFVRAPLPQSSLFQLSEAELAEDYDVSSDSITIPSDVFRSIESTLQRMILLTREHCSQE